MTNYAASSRFENNHCSEKSLNTYADLELPINFFDKIYIS